MRGQRIVAFDYLRGLIVVLVVLHHSVLAYCGFGHFDRVHYLWSTAPIVDASRWVGFDLIVLFNDNYFMPLMFLLSGLFVWPSLARKGSLAYGRDRLLRLGVPFAIAVISVMPLAYYPSFRLTGSTIGFGEFWANTIFRGPWPSGPAWFIGVLLAFDLAAAVIHAIFRRATPRAFTPRPWQCFALLLLLSAICYLPLLILLGPTRWFTFGPLAVQASRVGLYGFYFVAGIWTGRNGLQRVSAAFGKAAVWRWPLLAGLLYLGFVGLQIALRSGWLSLTPLARLGIAGSWLVLFCAAANVGWFAIVLRYARRATALGDSLAANAYGIYLLHYAAVLWMQYALLDLSVNAIVKAALVFTVALVTSWGATSALRQIPRVASVI